MKYLLFALVIVLASCNGDSIEQNQKGDFKIELLFEHEGVKVYRFYDGGYYRYYTNRGGMQWEEKHGKTTTYQQIP